MISFVDSNPHICRFSVTNNHVFDTYHKYNILFPNQLKKSKYLKDNFKMEPHLSEKLTCVDDVIKTREMSAIFNPTFEIIRNICFMFLLSFNKIDQKMK